MGYPHFKSECSEHWPTITICGSMRFKSQMMSVAEKLSIKGYIVLMPFISVSDDMQNDQVKKDLDALHFKKIDLSEEIIVVSDETGYYGWSTVREIEYARERHKKVSYYKASEEQ